MRCACVDPGTPLLSFISWLLTFMRTVLRSESDCQVQH